MYIYYLSIGSNIGNIKHNINICIDKISNVEGIKLLKVAPYYFTEPLLPQDADESYFKIYCNTCIKIETSIEPFDLLKITQNIETKLGREKEHKHWSPRVIDIDIIYCEKDGKQVSISSEKLTIPHKELFNRAFVINPLSYLNSGLIINGRNVLMEGKKHKDHQAVKMGIVNITHNSFTGDGLLANNDKNLKKIKRKIKNFLDDAVAIIDIGCEATNPNAEYLTYQEEIERLKPVIEIINELRGKKEYKYSTRFSIDTYHPETAEFCIQNGFVIINDVNGFKDERMWKLMQKYSKIEAVIMHSLTPHADKNIVLDKNCNVIDVLNKWVDEIEELAKKYNISSDRIIVDYGIGFGKTAFQSWQILKNVDKINNHFFRVLIGHSKKSFMSLFDFEGEKIGNISKKRAVKTIELSIELEKKGVDVLRVHNIKY